MSKVPLYKMDACLLPDMYTKVRRQRPNQRENALGVGSKQPGPILVVTPFLPASGDTTPCRMTGVCKVTSARPTRAIPRQQAAETPDFCTGVPRSQENTLP
jgi:hypothetical protein